MRNSRVLAGVLMTALSMAAVFANAEEELFDTKTAEKHIEQGIAYLKANNYDAAINEFEESTAVLPDAESFYYLGYAYYMKGRKQDGESRKMSMENFEKAYELDPNFTPTRFKPAEPAPAGIPGKQDLTASPEPVAPQSSTTPTPPQPEQLKP
jgi:tetratricopeptide (TPR) repeat protein